MLLPNFLKGEAKSLFESNFELGEVGGGGFYSYAGGVQFLLQMYATDANIERFVEELDSMRQREDESERAFADRLRRKARTCGPVYNESTLITRFLRGVSPDLKPLLRLQRQDFKGTRAFYDFVERATAVGDAHRALLLRHAKRPKEGSKASKVFSVQDSAPRSMGSTHRRTSRSHRASASNDPVLLTERVRDIDSDSSSSHATATEFEGSGIQEPDMGSEIVAAVTGQTRPKAPRQPTPPDGVDICYACFETGHRSTKCRFSECGDDPQFQRYALCNFARLQARQREFIDSVGKAPSLLFNYEPPLAPGNTKPEADMRNARAARRRPPESPHPSNADDKSVSFHTATGQKEN